MRVGPVAWRVLRTVLLSVWGAVFAVTAAWLILVVLGVVGDIANRLAMLLVQIRFYLLGVAFVCSLPFFWLRWEDVGAFASGI